MHDNANLYSFNHFRKKKFTTNLPKKKISLKVILHVTGNLMTSDQIGYCMVMREYFVLKVQKKKQFLVHGQTVLYIQ